MSAFKSYKRTMLLMSSLTLALLLQLCKFADLNHLNFVDSHSGTQYAVLPEISLDYAAAKKICTDNDAHLVQFTKKMELLNFLAAYNDSQILKMDTIIFWISAMKLKNNFSKHNFPAWKADDGSGRKIERFDPYHWIDQDEEGLEPKECLTFVIQHELLVADYCSNRNSVVCMRPLSDFGNETGLLFKDLGNQYVFTKDRPLKYSEAKTRCLGLHATLVSFQSDLSLSSFVKTLANVKLTSKNTGFKFWLSAKRTADKYETGENIWIVDNGLGTVFPRLTNVKWVDSRGTADKAADCLYFDVESNAFKAVDCGKPQSIICMRTQLELVPYFPDVTSHPNQTTNTTVRVTSQRTNDASTIDNCSGQSLVTKVLSCLLIVMVVVSVTVSILFIIRIRKSKAEDLYNAKRHKTPFSSSRSSKKAKSRSSATTDKGKSKNVSVYYNPPGNEPSIEVKKGKTPSISKKPGLKCRTKIKSPTHKSAKTAAPNSATFNYPYTDYEFVGKPTEHGVKNAKS